MIPKKRPIRTWTSGALIDFNPKKTFEAASGQAIKRAENRFKVKKDGKEQDTMMYQYSIVSDQVTK
jgi:hypothetical protein